MIDVDALSSAIMEEIYHYSNEATEQVKQACKEEAKNCLDEIKQTSPKQTGQYKKGWKVVVELEDKYNIRLRVKNTTNWRLTHLLEYGHLNRDGSRTEGRPHIKPAEEKANKRLIERIRRTYNP